MLGQLKKLLEREEMGFLRGIIKSKKLGATVAGILTVILGTTFGLDDGLTTKIVSMVMTYVGAQGVVDFSLALKGAKKE